MLLHFVFIPCPDVNNVQSGSCGINLLELEGVRVVAAYILLGLARAVRVVIHGELWIIRIFVGSRHRLVQLDVITCRELILEYRFIVVRQGVRQSVARGICLRISRC